jgi:glycosyltransferase involved in cell wall biosynthesis
MVKTKPVSVKILFFIDGMIAGGKERRLTQLMKALRAKPGIAFELVVMNADIHYKEIFDWNIKVHYLIRKAKKDTAIFRKFYKICRAFKPDIVHCWDNMTAIYAIPSCTLLRIKLVNGMVVDTPVNRGLFNEHILRARISFLFSAKVVGNSYAGLAAYGAPSKKSVCIYNGMDFSRFENLKDPLTVKMEVLGKTGEHTFIAGMVAAFEERKDYHTLIKAAKRLVVKHNALRFVLVGGGINFEEIKKSIPPELNEKIILLGKRNDVESVVNIFDAGILLTNTKVHGEGVSNSIIEYMALSKPVIATRGGGTDEVVIDAVNGYLVDAGNDDQLVEKIELLYNNKELGTALGNKGKQMTIEKFDLSVMAERYLTCYQSLVN